MRLIEDHQKELLDRKVFFSNDQAEAGYDLAQAESLLKRLTLFDVSMADPVLHWDDSTSTGFLSLTVTDNAMAVNHPWLKIPDKAVAVEYYIGTPEKAGQTVKDSDGRMYAFINRLYGQIYALGILFDLEFSDRNFRCMISDPDGLKVKDLLKTFMGGEIDLPMPDLAIASADFQYQGGDDKVIVLSVDTTGTVKPFSDLPFLFDQLNFDLQLWDMQLRDVRLSAVCTAGSHRFSLSGEYGPEGFVFQLEYVPDGSKIDISTLLKDLGYEAGFNIPDFAGSLTISGLSFSIHSRTREVSFLIRATCTFNEGAGLPSGKTGNELDVLLSLDGSFDKSANIPLTYKFSLTDSVTIGDGTKAKTVTISVDIEEGGKDAVKKFYMNFTDVTFSDLLGTPQIPFVTNYVGFIETGISGFKDSSLGKCQLVSLSITSDSDDTYLRFAIDPDLNLPDLLISIGLGKDNVLVTALTPETGKDGKSKVYAVTELSFSHSKNYGSTIEADVASRDSDLQPAGSSGGNSPGDDTAYKFRLTKLGDYMAGGFTAPAGGSISLSSGFPLQVAIHDLFFVHQEKGTTGPGFTLFGSDLDVRGNVDLSTIDVIGPFLSDVKFRFDSVRFTYASDKIVAKKVDTVNILLSIYNISPLVVPQSKAGQDGTQVDLEAGPSLQGTLVLGDDQFTIPLHSPIPKDDKNNPTDPALQDSPPPVTPTPVNMQFSGVHLESASLGMKDGKINITLTGGVHIGPVGMELIGFEIGSGLDSFSPSVSLQGLGVNVSHPPLTIDGLFAKTESSVTYNGQVDDHVTSYTGELVIGFDDFKLMAVGSYAQVFGSPSFFFYGFLGAPIIGIPPIITISGLALGFGYNRDVIMPAASGVDDFVLIEPIVKGQFPAFAEINRSIPILPGDYWLAVGLRIESLDMIKGLLVLVAKFGNELEIDILGRAEMVFPKTTDGGPGMAKLIIGIVATILPSRGVIAVTGEILAGSYIYNPSVSLTGGFALLSLTKTQDSGQWAGGKAGECVVTLGGYSPLYTKKPAYYPIVPRLAMTWKPYDSIDVRGEMYFAFVPEAFMLGGHIEANYSSGGSLSLSAHFEAGLDFILFYQPYHYRGNAYADLQASASVHVLFAHVTVHFELSADIGFWGPDFGGHACVSVHVLVSFSFGIDFGPSEAPPPLLTLDQFLDSFFSNREKILTASVTSGTLASLSQPDTGIQVVNPKELELEFSSLIPVKEIIVNDSSELFTCIFGVKPMAATNDDTSSKCTLKVRWEGKDYPEMDKHFTQTHIMGNFPSAMWQPADKEGTIPDASGDALMSLCSGLKLKAVATLASGSINVAGQTFDDLQMPANTWGQTFSY